jgi:hypothetical protein
MTNIDLKYISLFEGNTKLRQIYWNEEYSYSHNESTIKSLSKTIFPYLDSFLRRKGPVLTRLELISAAFWDIDLQNLWELCPKLITLKLEINMHPFLKLSRPGSWSNLGKLKRLRCLTLKNVVVTEEDVRELLTGRRRLRELSLKRCQMMVTPHILDSIVTAYDGHGLKRLSLQVMNPFSSGRGDWTYMGI